MSRYSCRLPFALAALSAATASFAQAPDTATELPPLIVTASPFSRPADELVQPVDVLAGEDLDASSKRTLGDTLEGQLGVSSSDFGPGVGRPVIRGQGGARVLVLDNGLGTHDVSTVSADHAVAVDPAHAEQVEIIKGPATLIYGSAASAGVINVVNPRLREDLMPGLHGSLNLDVADNANERSGQIGLSYGIGHFVFGADYARREADNFDIPGFAERFPEEEEHEGEHEEEEEEVFGRLLNSDFKTDSGAVYGAWVRPNSSLSLAVSQFDTVYGIPGGGHGHHEEEGHGEEAHEEEEEAIFDGVRIDLQQRRIDAQGLWNAPFAGADRLRVRLGQTDYEHTEIEPSGEAGTLFENDEFEGRVELTQAPLGHLHGVVGVQYTQRDFFSAGEEAFLAPVETTATGLFVVEELRYDWGRLEAGGRIERVQHRPAALTGVGDPNVDPRTGAQQPEVDFTPVSLSLGALVELDASHHFRLGVTRAERAPVAEELFAFGPHLATGTFERGLAAADKEVSTNLELSLDRHVGPLTWTLNFFFNPVEDYLYLAETTARQNADGSAADAAAVAAFEPGAPDRVEEDGTLDAEGELLLVDVVQDDADFFGSELELRYALLRGATRLSVRGFTDLVRGRLVRGQGDLPRITPNRYGVGLFGGVGPVDAQLEWTRVASQSRVSALETTTDGYELLSANLSYTLQRESSSATFYVRGRNLLDEEARRHTSFLKDVAPLPGRTAVAGVQLRF